VVTRFGLHWDGEPAHKDLLWREGHDSLFEHRLVVWGEPVARFEEPLWSLPAAPVEVRVHVRPAVVLAGSLAQHEIDRPVRSTFGRFRGCYQQALERSPDLSGRVTLSVVIGADGRVASVKNTADSNLPDGGVIQCLEYAIEGLSFPRRGAGVSRATVTTDFGTAAHPGQGT
jgi:hypothetical protein